ncbi:hypothetical protein CJF30_00011162 [Rutstroemia sp. NJR-2017a BBW]|nr:hypothetical protein CJF30_00011162 [Rutstroemia sp. NJR-2017a BBW]
MQSIQRFQGRLLLTPVLKKPNVSTTPHVLEVVLYV